MKRVISTLVSVVIALVGVFGTGAGSPGRSGVLGQIGFAPVARAASCPWMNTSLSPEQRASMLLKAMTIDDEIAMVHQAEPLWYHYGMAGYIQGNTNLCIPDLALNDAGQGVGDMSINTTAFPAPISQTASWDPAAQHRMGQSLGWEAFHKGVNIQLAPGLNIARVPMNDRNWEYMGEDPYLTGQTAAAEVAGIQSQHVIATIKHYMLNNQETNRMSISSDADARTIHEIYLPGFETAVKQGHAGAVMCSYNEINSVYACENATTLNQYLKREIGFSGFVMSDWNATHSTVAAANNGLDMEMAVTPGTYFGSALKTAVQSGQVPKSRLDNMVYRILLSMFRVGLFDYPVASEPEAYAASTETPAEIEMARQVSENGTVLLKNAGGVLPLNGLGKKIALIGKPAAAPQLVYNGFGSGHIPEAGTKTDVVSPLQGITQAAIPYQDTVTYTDGSAIQDAVAAATVSDVAIVFAYDSEVEGTDRPDLNVDDDAGVCTLACVYQTTNQNELISAVAAANPNTIVVLNTGGPVEMPWINQVKGVIEAWYPGQEYGNAIAPILFGQVNPSAKLPQTFPKSESDLPTQTAQQYPGVNGHATYSEGLLVGYRWFDAKGIAPLFCFGHGLSYTTFKYSGLTVASTTTGASVSFTLQNSGSRAGAEVAQLYVGFPAAAGEPPKQLKGYRKVFLQPGESQKVTFTLDRRAFAYWSATSGWTVAPGSYRILVGSSSCDIRLSGSVIGPH